MAPQWSAEPPAARDFAAIRLMRVPTVGSIQGIATAECVMGTNTHWANSRTVPCDETGCALCRDGHPRRWHGYLDIYDQLTQRQTVVQVTDLGAQQLHAISQKYGTLRGLLLSFSRIAKRPNARIQVDARQIPQAISDLPAPVNIPAYMSVIWQTSGDTLEPTHRPTPSRQVGPRPITEALKEAIKANGRHDA